jgi:hypothetical protein
MRLATKRPNADRRRAEDVARSRVVWSENTVAYMAARYGRLLPDPNRGTGRAERRAQERRSDD